MFDFFLILFFLPHSGFVQQTAQTVVTRLHVTLRVPAPRATA